MTFDLTLEDLDHVDGQNAFCIVTARPLAIRPYALESGEWQRGSWLSWADTRWGRGVDMNRRRAAAYGEAVRERERAA